MPNEIKELFIQHIGERLVDEDDERDMRMSKSEIIYTGIMALGYNSGDFKKALIDYYEARARFDGESAELFEELKSNLEFVYEHYKVESEVFSAVATQLSQDKPLDVVINFIKEELSLD